MNQKIRKSIPQDAEHFVKIKERLPLASPNQHSEQGGFLLGTTLETYQLYIKHGFCLSALEDDTLVGFGILLPNDMVRKSEIWEKRSSAKWSLDISVLENNSIAYIEQLAFLKGFRKLVLALSYRLMHHAFESGARYVLTTTVRKPVVNKAAIPLIRAAGGQLSGNIDEVYPEVGPINSDIFLMEKKAFYRSLEKRICYDFLQAQVTP